MNFVQRFMIGFGFLFSGTKGVFKIPGLFVWAIIPFVIVFITLILGISFGIDMVGVGIAQAISYIITPSAGFWYSLVFYPLYVILGIGFVALTAYLGFILVSVVASPFNAILAEKVLMHEGVIDQRDMSFSEALRLSIKMLGVSLLRAAIFIFLGILIFAFSFVPGVNLFASFCAFLILAFDCMDYSLEARIWSLRDRFVYFRKHFAEFSGMASALGLTLLVPGLTLLMLPSSVIGAALVMSKREKIANDPQRNSPANM